MPLANRVDPYRNFNFTVEIAGTTLAHFLDVSGLGIEMGEVEYREGSDKTTSVRKLSGLTKHTNVTLKRGVTNDQTLFNWMKNVRNGVPDKREVVITLRDEQGQVAVSWKLHDAMVVKWTGPTLNAKGDEAAVESIELVYEEITQEA